MSAQVTVNWAFVQEIEHRKCWYRLVGALRGNGITYSLPAVRVAMRDYERAECMRRAREHD